MIVSRDLIKENVIKVFYILDIFFVLYNFKVVFLVWVLFLNVIKIFLFMEYFGFFLLVELNVKYLFFFFSIDY